MKYYKVKVQLHEVKAARKKIIRRYGELRKMIPLDHLHKRKDHMGFLLRSGSN